MWSLGTEISWSSKKPSEHKQPRILDHRVSVRDGSKEVQSRSHGKHSKAEVHGNPETTKAVAWAVFQHHGGGGGGHSYSHGSVAVRRPSRFKIEAQRKQESAHRSLMSDVVAVRWDAGSTLFDSFELDSLLKTLDQAAGISQQNHTDADDGDEAGAVVVYSPKQGITRREQNDMRKHGHGEDGEDDSANGFGHGHTPKRFHRRHLDHSSTYEKPAKEVSHHKTWKNLLHSLHLDGANGLFHGLQKFQSQVAPHDSEKKPEHKGRSHKHNQKDGRHGQYTHIDVEQFDAQFDRNDLHVSKNVHPPFDKEEYDHRHQLWKLSFKAVLTQPLHGHKGYEASGMEQPRKGLEQYHEQADLRSAWAAFTANLHHQGRPRDDLEAREQSGVAHHHHYQHHHHHDEGEDFEMTVQAISRRVARTSFEVRRVSIELDGGLEAPRNSLDADGERVAA